MFLFLLLELFWLFIFHLHLNVTSQSIESILETTCRDGNLRKLEKLLRASKYGSDARVIHTLSNLEFILRANYSGAVLLHKLGKSANSQQIPPLAQMHLNGSKCRY